MWSQKRFSDVRTAKGMHRIIMQMNKREIERLKIENENLRNGIAERQKVQEKVMVRGVGK